MKKTVGGNNKQHVNKEIMLRTNLTKKANKTKKEEDVRRYKKQRNLIVRMNKKAKREYYKIISPKSIDNDSKVWKIVKPMFSNAQISCFQTHKFQCFQTPKEIMLRTNLTKKANKTKKEEDVRRYKKQRNLIVRMNKKAKREYYKIISPKSIDNDSKVWKIVKPMFSNANPMSDKKILFEDEKVITDDTEIAKSFNTYFLNITDSLGLSAPEDIFTKDLDITVTNVVEKYRNHPGI